MKKPDRFERMVARLPSAPLGTCLAVRRADVRILLRRQHAAVVRVIKKTYKQYGTFTYESDLLTALAQWKRGSK